MFCNNMNDMMMQRLGVSDRNSYPWSTPIWGHQFGMLPSTPPPPPPTPVKEKSSKKEEALKEEELHDCEADGNGKGKKPKKKK